MGKGPWFAASNPRCRCTCGCRNSLYRAVDQTTGRCSACTVDCLPRTTEPKAEVTP